MKKSGIVYKNIIMDFSGIYDLYDSNKKIQCEKIDFTDLSGTDCYCDDLAVRQIEKRIAKVDFHGIHFIDSGNYHYVSELWMQKIHKKFILLVFDNHPDMQSPRFGNILSCGSWIKDCIKTNPNVAHVFSIGVRDDLTSEVKANEKEIMDTGKITLLNRSITEQLSADGLFTVIDHEIKEDRFERLPIYISVDKDVFSRDELITNWDQGNMKYADVEEVLRDCMQQYDVVGLDVCGEMDCAQEDAVDMNREVQRSEQLNQKLYKLFQYNVVNKVKVNQN